MISLYHYPKCSTCKKAIKFLKEAGLDFTEKDIKENPPTETELKKMLAAYYGGELKKLFNTSGLEYRSLGLKDKLAGMSEDEAIEMLSGNGMLLKRPFLLTKGVGLVGFKEEDWKNALL